MKRYFLWGIAIAAIMLVLSISSFWISSAENDLTKTNTDAIKIKKIREYDNKGDSEAFIKAANEYLKSDPNNKEMLIRLARSYKDKKRYSLAEETIAKALNIDPKDPWALRVLAKINREQYEGAKNDELKKKYLNLAQAAIESSLAYSPKDPYSNGEAALIYFYKKDKVKALQAIDLTVKGNNPKLGHYKALKEKIKSMP